MSEFTNKSKKRVEQLTNYAIGLINHENGKELLTKQAILSTHFTPSDVLEMFDRLFELNISMDDIKEASNKVFNILYKQMLENPAIQPQKHSFIGCMMEDNRKVTQFLNETKPFIKQINKHFNTKSISILKARFDELQHFLSHYVVKENVLFPLIEQKWKNNLCLKLMWSFHDDIRRNIKSAIKLLGDEEFDLELFNKISSKIYFNINTIIFREERVLFPVMLETFKDEDFEDMLQQASEIGLHFAKIVNKPISGRTEDHSVDFISFKTGILSLEQAELIFNHLPVDVTFVDETDTVKFFSNPKHRIFSRSTGIIGRKVQNCHPHDSVEIVNRIINSFKNGEKDIASFWIQIGEKYVLIQYYAVRNAANVYKGVLEVSQEISEIQKINGEKRLLDWDA